ncbi:MAG: O-antigen ligase family protein [Clostridium sartagoforme]|nr:O-antigen ligase family protein [Clostridium sartagoforme]
MKKFYNNSVYLITLAFIVSFALLPSYGKINPDIFIYLLFILVCLSFIIFPEERKAIITNIKTIITKDKIFLSLIALNLLMYFSVFVAVNKSTTISHSIRFSMYLFLFYLISYKFNKNQILRILASFLFSSIIVSFITLYQVVNTKILGNNIDMDHRIASTLENPNNLGVYSIIVIFIFIMLFIQSKDKRSKVIYSISSILLLFNIIVSQSRNSILALVAGLIILLFFYNKRYVLYSAILPILLIILPQTRGRILDIFDMTQNSSRIKIWKITEIMINNKNQLFGIGYENYSIEYPRYVESNMTYFVRESLKAQHPHNALLKFQVELGILGSIVFLSFICICIWSFYKYIVNNLSNTNNYIYLGMFTSFICFQIMNIIDCYYGPIKIMYSFFILLGILNNHLLESKKI